MFGQPTAPLAVKPFISLGAQGGGPETAVVGQSKLLLYRALARHVTSTHCAAIDEYGPVLRVDGTLHTFGDEGFTRMRFAKKQRYITLDIQIPMACWQPLDDSGLRCYLARQVRSAIELCVARLRKDGHAVDELRLMTEIDAAISDYTSDSRVGSMTPSLT